MDYKMKPGREIVIFGEVSNNHKPTISIITPFYNGEKTLMETVNAILSQTYPYFEWIIVDDGSTDKKSIDLLKKVEKLDNRIKVYHKENEGPSQARDFGISKASECTKYVFFADCDDIPEKTMLECLYWTLETHPEASFAYPASVNFGDQEFLWEKWLEVEIEKKENVICISTLVKKSDLLEVGCFGIKEKRVYEDWNLWLKLLRAGKIPIRVSDTLFWYRVSNSGEFSRAKRNNKGAMEYIKETAKSVKSDVNIIQYPFEGNINDTVKEYKDIVVPIFKRNNKKKNILFVLPWMTTDSRDVLKIVKGLSKDKYNISVVTTNPNNNTLEQEFKNTVDAVYDLSSFLDRSVYINFVDYLVGSRNIDLVVVSGSEYGYYMTPYLKSKYPNLPIIDYVNSLQIGELHKNIGECSYEVDSYLTNTYVNSKSLKNKLEKDFKKTNVELINDKNIVEKNVKIADTNESFVNDYLVYNLALERLYQSYFKDTKDYIINTYGYPYEGYQAGSKRKKLNSILYRNSIISESLTIHGFIYSINKFVKDLIAMLKQFVKAILATISLIKKLLFK